MKTLILTQPQLWFLVGIIGILMIIWRIILHFAGKKNDGIRERLVELTTSIDKAMTIEDCTRLAAELHNFNRTADNDVITSRPITHLNGVLVGKPPDSAHAESVRHRG